MIKVLSKRLFDILMKSYNLNDDNVIHDNRAFISINHTKAVLGSLYEEEKPHFKLNHHNVLVLTFDDIVEDCVFSNGNIAKAMTVEQANEIIKFLDNNKGKDFLIHCQAGISRSGAVGRFACEYLEYNEESFNKNHPHINPNPLVTSLLRHVTNYYGYN